jgi:hypothetical protein
MIKKIIIFIIFVLAIAVIADYYGVVEISFFKDKPKIFETRDNFLHKRTKQVDSDLK